MLKHQLLDKIKDGILHDKIDRENTKKIAEIVAGKDLDDTEVLCTILRDIDKYESIGDTMVMHYPNLYEDFIKNEAQPKPSYDAFEAINNSSVQPDMPDAHLAGDHDYNHDQY